MYVYIYSSVLHIYKRHFCKDQICANPFFCPVQVVGAQEVWVALKNMARVAVAYTSSNSYAALELSKLHGCILT